MATPDLKLSLIQSDIVWENPEANLLQYEKRIGKCETGGLILLPEMFSSGFTMNLAAVAEDMNGLSVNFLKQSAILHKSHVGGSLIIREGSHHYNRFVVASPSGELTCYDKRHLFRMTGENEYFTAGDKRVILTLQGWKIMLQICYDLRFPVFSRNRIGSPDEYDLCVYVANWPDRRAAHWQALLPARAIENQSFVAGLNRVGTDGNGMTYQGDSMIIGPQGDVLAKADSGDHIVAAHLSKEKLTQYRQKFPAWEDADAFRTGN